MVSFQNFCFETDYTLHVFKPSPCISHLCPFFAYRTCFPEGAWCGCGDRRHGGSGGRQEAKMLGDGKMLVRLMTGWWFQIIFIIFTPIPGGRWTHFLTHIFSNGLKPPTRWGCENCDNNVDAEYFFSGKIVTKFIDVLKYLNNNLCTKKKGILFQLL